MICGRVEAPTVLTKQVVELAQAHASDRLAELMADGNRYGGWSYWDRDRRVLVKIAVDLSAPDVRVASSVPLPDVPIVGPFAAHPVVMERFDDLGSVGIDPNGFVRWIDAGDVSRSWIASSRELAFGATIDEVFEGLSSYNYQGAGTWQR